MVFINPINIATAAMEEVYERLCWVYSLLRSTFTYDAIDNCCQLSQLTQLTRAKIPYPERFIDMIDYEQNALIKDLKTKSVLCTRWDWIRRGRIYHTVTDLHDSERQ